MITIEIRKQQLETQLAVLNARIRQIDDELDSHDATKDEEDRASEREEDEVLEGIGKTSQHEARMIDAALKRIETGEYGTCAKCGEAISEARLDLLPYTPFCKDCAQ